MPILAVVALAITELFILRLFLEYMPIVNIRMQGTERYPAASKGLWKIAATLNVWSIVLNSHTIVKASRITKAIDR